MPSHGFDRKFRAGRFGLLFTLVLNVALAFSSSAQDQVEPLNVPPCWLEERPNVTWAISLNIAGCPAGDSVVAGRPARERILVSYRNAQCFAKVGVPPESIWVVPTAGAGLNVNFQPAKIVVGQALRIMADDSTNVDGLARITIPSFSGCGNLTLDLYVSGVYIGTKTTGVRTVDTDASGQVHDPEDLSAPCDLDYNGIADDAGLINFHQAQGHWGRQVLFGMPVRRTSFCTSCNLGSPGSLGESQTAWSPDGKYVAGSMFVLSGGGWYSDCHVMYVPSDPKDGNGVTEFSTPPINVHDYNPSWSPLGYEIAFDRGDESIIRKGVAGLTGDVSEHVVVPVPGGAGSATSPAVSPDGKWIAYSSSDPSAPEPFTQDVWVIPVSGDMTKKKRLTSGFSTFFPQWSPDGEWVYFDQTLDLYPHRIMKVKPNISSGAPASDLQVAYEQSNAPANTRHDWTLFGFSPDGKIVAAGEGTRDEAQPLVQPARGLRTVIEGCGSWQQGITNYPEYQHTSVSVNTLTPKFSPDGTRLAFEAQPPGEQRAQLWATRRNMSLPPVISNVGGRPIVDATLNRAGFSGELNT